MNEQLKFINKMVDSKIEHYKFKMNSAKEDIKYHKSMTIIQDSANVVVECAIALETLYYVKEVCAQSTHFSSNLTEEESRELKELRELRDYENKKLIDDLDI